MDTDNIKLQVLDEDTELLNAIQGKSPSITTTTEPTISIETKVKDFISKTNPKLYILTPCFGGMCYINYMTCLINTITLFRQLQFPIQIEFCKNDSLVPRARNNLVARAMNDPLMTHIIFIDNDISWDPLDIIKLILSEKDIVGGIYPLKNYDWSKLLVDQENPYNSNIIQGWLDKKNKSQLRNLISDEKMIQNNLLTYNVNYLEKYLHVENNLGKVKHVATGFMMIKRDVFTKMAKSFPSTKYVDDVNFLTPEENAFAYALFDCGVEEGHYFSEDWLFCHRWMKMGNEIWMDVSINLTHTGIEEYSGSYISSII